MIVGQSMPQTVESQLQAAATLHECGQHRDAEAAYRAILAANPEHPWANQMLGNLLHQLGRGEEAIALMRRAIELAPHEPAFRFNHALACFLGGEGTTAQAEFGRVIELQPDNVIARNHLAILHLRAGRTDEAIAQWRAALDTKDDFNVIDNLAGVLAQAGQLDEALELAQRGIRVAPNRPEGYNTLGNIYVLRTRYDEALTAFAKALSLAPHFANGWANMALAYHRIGRHDDAAHACRRALEIDPSHPSPHRTLGLISYLKHDLDDAVAHWQRASSINPKDSDVLTDLAGAYANRGEHALALETYCRALAIRPTHAEAHSAYLWTLHHDPSASPRQIAREHFRFGELQEPLIPPPPPFTNSRDPDRTVRVGYVAPYFFRHAVATFIAPIFRHHHRGGSEFSVTCYSDTRSSDELTAFFKSHRDGWHDTHHLTDAELAEKIRADEIDILIDLSGHLAKNRLLMFARRAAPIQLTYIAYQNTTGLRAMDYRITDAIADPPGKTDDLHTEKLLRLPCFFVYDPPASADDVSLLPALSRGHVTLGSLNNSGKLNPFIIELWSRVLRRLPTARLMLLVNSRGVAEQIVREQFAKHGIDADRLDLIPRGSQAEYFKRYHEIDIALDTHPFSGHTTTCDALWMGVPVITLPGAIYASRMTTSVLANLPMPQWIANTADEYVDKIVALAGDLDGLAASRASLRRKMRESLICDGERFTRSLEQAYRNIWRHWCEEGT